MDGNHTQGRWVAAAKPSSVVGWPVVAAPMGQVICDVAIINKKPDHVSDGEFSAYYAQVEANARLIAAAPDLLKAAKLAEDIIDDFLGHLSPDEQTAGGEDSQAAAALKALRAAIRKARGE